MGVSPEPFFVTLFSSKTKKLVNTQIKEWEKQSGNTGMSKGHHIYDAG